MNTVVTIENGMECVFIMKVHHGGLVHVHARTSANACKMQQKPFPPPPPPPPPALFPSYAKKTLPPPPPPLLPFLSSKSIDWIGHSDFEFALLLICSFL